MKGMEAKDNEMQEDASAANSYRSAEYKTAKCNAHKYCAMLKALLCHRVLDCLPQSPVSRKRVPDGKGRW